MLSREDIESYLIRTEVDFQEIDEGLWLVHTDGERVTEGHGIVIRHEPPVAVLRSAIGEVPLDDSDQLALFRRLLELNATDLVHGAYGVEEGEVLLSDTLQLEDLDFSEFRASLESLTLALTTHWQEPTNDQRA